MADEGHQTAEIIDPATLTPMMRQYLEVKAQHPDALLFFRLGDFYELFFDDAVKAAEVLQITLTSRAKGADRVPMAGVPYHAAKRYIARLIEAGFSVAVCEQLEPPGKGIVKREVVRVITPATLLDEEALDGRESSFLGAVMPGEAWGAAALDGTTAELLVLEPGRLELIADELDRLGVKELVAPAGVEPELEPLLRRLVRRLRVTWMPADVFTTSRAMAYLSGHLGVSTLEGFGFRDGTASLGPAAAALRYLKDTQRAECAHVDRITVLSRGGHLGIDDATRLNLELTRSLSGGRAGTLLSVLDRTVTPMGARRLARWLSAPLADLAAIEARLDAVGELVSRASLRDELASALRRLGDVERLAGRLSLSSGSPRDLKALGDSLAALPGVAELLGSASAPLLRALVPALKDERVVTLAGTLRAALVDDPPATTGGGGFIRQGFDAGLDELLTFAATAKEALVKLEAEERERTKIASLKVRYNRVFGYYLEVTRANLHLVPSGWIRKQTTVGGERYVTEALKTFEERALTAEEKQVALELQLFEQLRALVCAHASAVRAVGEAVATVDVLGSLARVAAEQGYVRPSVDSSEVVDLIGSRHPVVERVLGAGAFVPNDVRLDRADTQLMIITGPNMAGKSTVMRQVALCVIMAQAGSFVPARSAHIGLVDRVFTRVGASDNLARGQSTFMVEMIETAAILHQATERSLVILDEIGRGTSTFDGLSIAWAVAEHLHDRTGARTLFATHYHELTDLSRDKARVRNVSIAVREVKGGVVFLRKLVDGPASKSYGIEVARLAGLPREVLARAKELLVNLEAGEFDELGRPRLARRATGDDPGRRGEAAQLALFGSDPRPPAAAAVLDLLRAFDVDASSPLDALTSIARWKAMLRS